jgi:hypothetical protein
MVGPLDNPMRSLAQTLTNTFSKIPKTFTRTVTGAYDPKTGSDATTVTSKGLITTPPAPYLRNEINGKSIRIGDLKIVVADKDIDESGFDPIPTDEARVTVEVDAVTYKVVNYRPFVSGDLRAATQFQIRK